MEKKKKQIKLETFSLIRRLLNLIDSGDNVSICFIQLDPLSSREVCICNPRLVSGIETSSENRLRRLFTSRERIRRIQIAHDRFPIFETIFTYPYIPKKKPKIEILKFIIEESEKRISSGWLDSI